MKNIILIFIFLLACGLLSAQKDSINAELQYKEFYYQNGKKSGEGYVKNGKPEGLWKSYYISGMKKSEGKWSNSKLDSIWVFMDQFADTLEKINYHLGVKNGYQLNYFKIGEYKNRIERRELYVNGRRNGNVEYYYGTGQLKKVVPYIDDKKQGIGFVYDKKGMVITIARYRNDEIIFNEQVNQYDEDGNKSGVWKEFYSNGNLKEESNYSKGKLHGYVKIYDEKGQLIESLNYKHGEIDLSAKDYKIDVELREDYDNVGNLIFQGSFRDGIHIGIHRVFSPEGKVKESKTYNIQGELVAEGIVLINGNEDGKWVFYHGSNVKRAEGSYRNGKKQDLWVYYYPNGKIQQKGTYLAGKFSGLWQWYYTTGELLKEEFYIYGLLDGESFEYSEEGEVIAKGNYIEGYKEGEWFYHIGDQRIVANYVRGLKDGVWRNYYLEEGSVSFEGRFIQGSADGKHVYYYPDGKVKEEQYYNEGERVRSWSKYDKLGRLVIVVQYRDGSVYKINGEKINIRTEES